MRMVLCLMALSLLAQFNPANQPVPEGRLSTAYRVEVLAQDLSVPWAITFLPEHRILFTERTGAVRVMHRDRLLPQPALKIDVALGNKMGMLGIAADPRFFNNHFVYLAYNYRLENQERGHEFRMRLVRYREKRDKLIEPKTLIEDLPAFTNHTGGRIRFAIDGTLFLTTGDANEPRKAQQLDVLNGKVLRLNTDGSPAAGNPLLHQEGARPEIWSYGHRNPQGLDFQPGTGRMLETEHGPLGGDEVNWIAPGKNYGWPTIDHRRTHEGMEAPLLEFTPSIAPGSASFYRGIAFPELRGNLLVACLRGEGILRVALEAAEVRKVDWLFHHTFGRIREVAESPEGYLYISTSQQDPAEGVPRPGEHDDLLLRVVPTDVKESGRPVYRTSPEFTKLQELPKPGTVEAVIGRKCAACHGDRLQSIATAKWNYVTDDAALRTVILGGIAEKGMPGAAELTEGEVNQLILFLRAARTGSVQ